MTIRLTALRAATTLLVVFTACGSEVTEEVADITEVHELVPGRFAANQDVEVVVFGQGFDQDSVVTVDGTTVPTRFVNDSALRVTLNIAPGPHSLSTVRAEATLAMRTYLDDIAFATQTQVAALANLQQHYMADLDGDGRDDIVASDDSAIHVLLRRSDVSYEQLATISLPAGEHLLRPSDIDGDGNADILRSRGIHFMRDGQPTGLKSFGGMATGATAIRHANGERSVVAAVATGQQSYSIRRYEITEELSLQPVASTPSQDTYHYDWRQGRQVTLDANRDGTDDIVFVSTRVSAPIHNFLTVVDGDTLETTQLLTGLPVGHPADGDTLIANDNNGDGQLDLIYGQSQGADFLVIYADADGIDTQTPPTGFDVPCNFKRYVKQLRSEPGQLAVALDCAGYESKAVLIDGIDVVGNEPLPWESATRLAIDSTGNATLRSDSTVDGWYRISALTFANRPRIVEHDCGGVHQWALSPDLVYAYTGWQDCQGQVWGTPTDEPNATWTTHFGDFNTTPSAASRICDIDSDGDDDVIRLMHYPPYASEVGVMRNADGALHDVEVVEQDIGFGGARQFEAADFDGDGACDLFVMEPAAQGSAAFLAIQRDASLINVPIEFPALRNLPTDFADVKKLWADDDSQYCLYLDPSSELVLISISVETQTGEPVAKVQMQAITLHPDSAAISPRDVRKVRFGHVIDDDRVQVWLAESGAVYPAVLSRDQVLRVGQPVVIATGDFVPKASTGDVDLDGQQDLYIYLGNNQRYVVTRKDDITVDRVLRLEGAISDSRLVDVDGDGKPDLVGLASAGTDESGRYRSRLTVFPNISQ